MTQPGWYWVFINGKWQMGKWDGVSLHAAGGVYKSLPSKFQGPLTPPTN